MKKILIVEDDKFLANAYRVKLAKEGFETKITLNGEEALAALKDFEPDLILLDLVMPKKDGFSTLSELKSDDRWKSIPVIIASNLGQTEDIEKGMKLGASEFIVKSGVALRDLVTKVKSLIQAS